MNKKQELIDICHEYCTGCGLCVAVNGTAFERESKGFFYPRLQSTDADLCRIVCPAAGNAANHFQDGTTWGKMKSCCLAWSSDDTTRFQASSGGVITSLCIYLLEKHMVDAVIQVKRNAKDQTKTITVVNTTKEAVLECCGSRYTSSTPLMNIKDLIETGKKYAFVGKPCDVSALRMLQVEKVAAWTEQIVYMFSFFCAGQPSERANKKLLHALQCDSVADIEDLSYRGNGWPGFAAVRLKNGSKHQMEYEKSWMTILGRDVRKSCRFCADGTGEQADISCGDAWYLTSEGKPDFTEAPGRNVVFARTQQGETLLKAAILDGVVTTEPYDTEKDNLKKSQPYHYNRKASLRSLKVAMKLCGRNFPLYSSKILKKFETGYPLKNKVLRCIGTIKRVWSKSI